MLPRPRNASKDRLASPTVLIQEVPLRWDSPLVATVAHELHGRLRGARLRAIAPEFEAQRLSLHFRELTLVIRLRPTESGIYLLDAAEPPPDARRLASKVRSVEAPPDDRLLVFSFLRVRGTPAQADLIVEWVARRHNAILTEGADRIVRMLFRTGGGRRPLRQGLPYAFPPPAPRLGCEGADAVTAEKWQAEVGGRRPADPAPVDAAPPLSPRELRRALLGTFAWTSPINAASLLDPEHGFRRWQQLARVSRGEVEPTPVVLHLDDGAQPYPMPVAGVEHTPAADLLTAFEQAARISPAPRVTLLPVDLVARLEKHVEALRARCGRLEEELQGLDDPDRVQSLGDLLLARFGEVPRGEPRVRLTDFEGSEVWLDVDPVATPDVNARRYYDQASRIRRARERLPDLIRTARERWETDAALLERARAGEATVRELEDSLPAERAGSDGTGTTLPYRRYRSSGGLEIRVGRGARRNDDLTFRHSSPDDVWLHARDTAGAHVILRWGRAETPPARDLAEAAVLAALGSKARTSGSVPVDWTLRKYVRKPRKAPPGLVTPDRVKTIFVEPDPKLESRLRDE